MWRFRFLSGHISQDTLSEYLDGRLRGGRLERVRRELDSCGACRDELEGLRSASALLRALPVEAPARSFVMSAPPLPERAPYRRPLALRAPTWAYAGAASVAILALAALVSIDALGQSEPESLDLAAAPSATRASAPATGGPSAALQTEKAEGQPSGAAPSAFSAAEAPPAPGAANVSPPSALAQTPAEDSSATAAGTEATAPQAFPAATSATSGAGEAAAVQGEETNGSLRAMATPTLPGAGPKGAPGEATGGATGGTAASDEASQAVEPTAAPVPAPARPPGEGVPPEEGGFPWLRVLEAVAGGALVLSLSVWLLARMAIRRSA